MKRHGSTASVTSSICSDGGTTGYGTLETPGQQQLHNPKLITHHDNHHQLNNSTSSSSSFTSSCSCYSNSLGAKFAHVQCSLQQGTGSVTTNHPFQHHTRQQVNHTHIRNATHQQSLQQQQQHQQQWFAAQTNTRLLAVLSDLVKAFIDSESAIQSFLNSFGSFLDQGNIAADNTVVADNNDLTSIGTVASMNILANNNANPNFNVANNNNIDSLTELIDDGPELITPSAALIGLNDPALLNDLAGQLSIDDDIVLGASRRLRAAVGRILHLFQTVMSLPIDQQKNKLHHLSQLSLTNSECDALGQINSNRASPTSDKSIQPKAPTQSSNAQPPDQTSAKHENKVHSTDDGTKGSSKGNQPSTANSPPSPQSSTTSSDNCNCNCNQEKKALFEELTRAQLCQKVLQEELDSKHRQLSSLKARIDSTLILDAQSLKETNDDLKHKLAQAENKIGQLLTLIEKLRTECQEKGVQIVTLIQQLEHLKQKQQEKPRDPQPSSPNFVTSGKEEPSKLPCQGLNVPNVNTQVGTSNTAKEPTGGQTGKKAKSEFLKSHPVTSTPASKKVGATSKSTVPTALRARTGVNSMGTVTSGSGKLINTEQLEEPKMNSIFETTVPHDNYSLHADEIARRRSLSPPESLIVDVKAPFTIGRHRESLLFEKTDLANLDDISSLSDDESQDGRLFDAKKVNDQNVTLPNNNNNNSSKSLLGASDTEFELTALFNQILSEKNEEITLLKEQMKLAQDMLSSTFGSGSFDKSPTAVLPPCNIDQVDLLEALSGKRTSVASSVESKQDKIQHLITDGQTENLIKSSPAKATSGTRVKSQKGRKNKFAGVDLIGPLAEHMPSTSTSGQITPKSTSGSSGCLAFNRGQSREEFVDDGFDDSPNTSFREVVQMGSRLDQLQTVILALVDKNQAAQRELSQLKSQLSNKEQMITQLSDDKSSLESQINSLKIENESLLKQLKVKDDEVRSASVTAKNSFDRQLVYYKNALELKDEEILSYEERISGLLRKIDSLKNDSEQNRTLGRAEQAEYTEQISQLKNYIKDQAKKINSYEAKSSSLLSKIESLRLQNDLMKAHEKRVEELELQLKTAEEINAVKKDKIRQLMDTIGKQSNEIKLLTQSNMNAIDMTRSRKVATKDAAVEAKAVLSKSNSLDDATFGQNHLQMHLLRKTLHEKRSLIYQKQYLLNVLSGFQLSEKATLGLLANISDSFIEDAGKSFGRTAFGDLNYLSPKSKFRSAVYVIISLMRMKKLVIKWSLPK